MMWQLQGSRRGGRHVLYRGFAQGAVPLARICRNSFRWQVFFWGRRKPHPGEINWSSADPMISDWIPAGVSFKWPDELEKAKAYCEVRVKMENA